MDHWVLGWALVKLDSNRFTYTQLQNVGFIYLFYIKFFYLLISLQIPSPSSLVIFEKNVNPKGWNELDWIPRVNTAVPTKDAALRKGSYLFKIGRTTGHTAGKFHDIDPSVTIMYAIDGPR